MRRSRTGLDNSLNIVYASSTSQGFFVMDIPTDFGSATVFTKELQRKSRVANLRKTIYNFGCGVEELLAGKSYVPWLCSLTYRDVDGWSPNDIRFFLNRVRVYLYRRGLPFVYCWVAELQKRGALHYHVMIWLPKGFKLPKFARFGWWEHGFTDQKPAQKAVGYLMKYISKDDTKNNFPKGVRIYGYGGASVEVKRRIRFFRCNKQIRSQIEASGLTYRDVDMRKVQGGKVDLCSGWFFESCWKVYFLRGLPVFFKVADGYEDFHLLIDICEKIDYYI